MYNIICRNKHLAIAKKSAPIYQNDNRIDYLRFLIQPEYDNIELSNYSVFMQIELPDEQYVIEPLSISDETYRDYMIAEYLITNGITNKAGVIKVCLYIFYYDEETEKMMVMNTDTVSIPILESAYTGAGIDIEETTPILESLQSQIDTLKADKIDSNFVYNAENGTLQFYANGSPIGEPIPVDNEVHWENWNNG